LFSLCEVCKLWNFLLFYSPQPSVTSFLLGSKWFPSILPLVSARFLNWETKFHPHIKLCCSLSPYFHATWVPCHHCVWCSWIFYRR
jgi:hypothetical protein